jgi:uncharacterized protein (DUF1330 family)
MNQRIALGLTLLTGIAIGGAAISALHAQAKPPTYAVVDISEITDPEGWKAVTDRPNAAAAAVFKDLGGKYLARTGNITALDGAAPKRFVIIAFDSPEKAQAWNSAPAQKEINAIRVKTTKSRVFLVEGMPN